MVGMVLVLVVVLVAVGVVAWLSLQGTARRSAAIDERLHDPDTPTVLYPLPADVEPAEVRSALELAGYDSTIDVGGAREVLRVECPESERETIRTLIGQVHVNEGEATIAAVHGPVRFLDDAA